MKLLSVYLNWNFSESLSLPERFFFFCNFNIKKVALYYRTELLTYKPSLLLKKKKKKVKLLTK